MSPEAVILLVQGINDLPEGEEDGVPGHEAGHDTPQCPGHHRRQRLQRQGHRHRRAGRNPPEAPPACRSGGRVRDCGRVHPMCHSGLRERELKQNMISEPFCHFAFNAVTQKCEMP